MRYKIYNHAPLRGVAARTRSVHLMYSNDRKRGARTHSKQHHAVPQRLNENLVDHRKPSTNIASTALTTSVPSHFLGGWSKLPRCANADTPCPKLHLGQWTRVGWEGLERRGRVQRSPAVGACPGQIRKPSHPNCGH